MSGADGITAMYKFDILTNKWVLIIIFIFAFYSIASYIYANFCRFTRIDELKFFNGGLNIEGGDPLKVIMKTNPNTIWANIVIILDRPMIDNIIFDKLVKEKADNNYPLLENTIQDLNEREFLSAYLQTALYYIDYSYRNFEKKESVKIVIHFHQDKLSISLIKIFDKLLKELRVLCKLNEAKKIIIEYRNDCKIVNLQEDEKELLDVKVGETSNFYQLQQKDPNYNYGDADIVLSFSQCAGIYYRYKTGAILWPNKFIPYDISNKTIYESKTYFSDNHITESLYSIIESNRNKIVTDYLNENYESANKTKKHKCVKLTKDDFINAPILQVSELWNPTNKTEKIKIK